MKKKSLLNPPLRRGVLVAASLLSADFGNLKREIDDVTRAGADILHLDIMDGHYVPNLTFGLPIIKTISSLSKIPLDAHLMVTNPEFYIEALAYLGVKYFSFHPETVYHTHRVIETIKSHNMKAGVAINPGLNITSIIDLLPTLDFVLIMTVNPGFGGQKFIESCLDKIIFLDKFRKEKKLNFEIEIDGGICADNIQKVINAGTDIVVAGAYIFGHKDYSLAIKSLIG